MNAKPKAQGVKAPLQTSSRRSTTDSVKSDVDVEDISSAPSSPASLPRLVKKGSPTPSVDSQQQRNEVVGEYCLICNDRCFVRPNGEKLTERESRLSYELREVFYEIYQIPLTSDFINLKSARSEFPLCYSCSFHLGQLKTLYDRLKALHRDFIKFQEVVAFSIVDIVAGSVPQRPLLDFAKLSDETTLRFMRRNERTTLQNMIYNDWHNKVPSFPDYESDDIPKIVPLVDAPQVSEGAVPGLKIELPENQINPSIFSRPILSRPSAALGRSAPSKRFKMDTTIMAQDDKGQEEEDVDPNGEGEMYDYYEQGQEQDDNSEAMGEGEQSLGDETEEDMQHFANGGHFLDGVEGGEEDYNEYEQLYEDAGFVNNGDGVDGEGMRRRDSMAESIGDMSSNNIEYQQNEDGLFVCMFCNKTFIHKYPYRDHLKTHTGEGPRCPICNKIFPKNHNLMLHMRTHTGEKPYKCSVCGKGFADKSNLKVHMRVHTGERPYKCEYCDLSFVNSSRLVVHRRQHLGKTLRINTNQVNSHRKIHMNFDQSRPFGCNTCGMSFSTDENLRTHSANYHPTSSME